MTDTTSGPARRGGILKIGVYGLLWTPGITIDDLFILDKCREFGLDGIEIPLLSYIQKQLPVPELKSKAADLGLKLITSTGLEEKTSIISEDRKKRERGKTFLKKCIDLAHELGSDQLSGVIYAPWAVLKGRRRTDWEYENCVQSLREVADHAEPAGVYLCLEPVNRYEGYFLNTAEQGKELLKDIGRKFVKLHLDSFQMNIEEQSMYGAVKTAGEDLYHFHVCASHRGIPGTGHIEWDEIFRAFKEIGYDNWLVIESFAPNNPDIGANVCIWRDLAESSDAIAREGSRFLREILKKHEL
jgi:D-psicose/D-tagatose/L-ribulose 3-epimerase